MKFENSLRPPTTCKRLVSREVGFDDSKCCESYPDYSPFSDIHMREYWMSPTTRQRLTNIGLLNHLGTRLLDPDKERRKLAAAEQVVKAAWDRVLVQEEKRRKRLIGECALLQREIVNNLKYQHVQSHRRKIT